MILLAADGLQNKEIAEEPARHGSAAASGEIDL